MNTDTVPNLKWEYGYVALNYQSSENNRDFQIYFFTVHSLG